MAKHPALLRGEHAKIELDRFKSLYDDCYKWAIPMRHVLVEGGTDHSVEIFDSTAPDSTVRFANRIQNTMFPPEYRWITFEAGDEVPVAMKTRVNLMLDAVSEVFFQLMRGTNLDVVINEALLDLAAGQAPILMEDLYDVNGMAMTFSSYPSTHAVTGEGVDGRIANVWLPRKMRIENVRELWPDAQISQENERKLQDNPNAEMKIMISTTTEDKEVMFRIFEIGKDSPILESSFRDSFPWACARWSKVSGEHNGRGPLTLALGDIKTLNKTVELILQNASLSVIGVYTAADDGVLNPDMVDLTPGSVVPVAFNGGVNGRSLDILPRAGDFDVAQLVLNDLRSSVRRKMMDDIMAPLDEAVRSAAEVYARQRLLADAIGPAYPRIKRELIEVIVNRCLYVWGRRGWLPKMKVDGKLVKLGFASPQAQIQANEDLNRLSDAAQRANAVIPNLSAILFKPEEVGPYIAERSGVPQRLVNDMEALVQAQKDLGAMYAQGDQNVGKALMDANG